MTSATNCVIAHYDEYVYNLFIVRFPHGVFGLTAVTQIK